MATSVLIPTAAHRGARSARLALPAATVLPDADRRVEVRLGDAAAAQIRAGIAAGVIWIDEATGPPRDSAERGPQLATAIGMVVVSLCWDQLFFVYDVLPATIPPASCLPLDGSWPGTDC